MRYALQGKALVQPLSSAADLIFTERAGRPRSPPPHRDRAGGAGLRQKCLLLAPTAPGRIQGARMRLHPLHLVSWGKSSGQRKRWDR